MSSARVHTRNLLYNWSGHAANLLVLFFLSPYIVGKLDAVVYGIWSLLNVLTGYMGLFDLGVRASVGRHIALYLGKQDKKAVDETVRAGLGFYSLVSVLILVIGVVLGWLFPEIFRDVPVKYYSLVRMLLPLMVLNVWLSAVSAIYASILAAHDRFDIARKIDIGILALRTAATVWVLQMGWGLWGLAGAVILGNLLAVVGNRLCSGHIFRSLRSWPLLYSKARLKELVGYGFPAFLSAVSSRIIGQTDLVIAGAAISVAIVREYSVGAMIVFYSSTFLTIIGRTFFPAMQRAIGAKRMGEARHILHRQTRLGLCLCLLIYIGFAVYSKPFIHLWMFQKGFNETSVLESARVMTILAIAQLPLLYTRPSLDFLAAAGHINLNAGMAIIEALLNLGLSLYFVLILNKGLMGIALGTLVSRLVVSGSWTPFYLKHKSGIPIKHFLLNLLLPGSLSGLLLYTFCTLIRWRWHPSTWYSLGWHILIVSLFWGLIVYSMLLPADYRQRVRCRLHRVWSKATPTSP